MRNYPFSVPFSNQTGSLIILPPISVMVNTVANVDSFVFSEAVHFVVKTFGLVVEWSDGVVRANWRVGE